MSHRNCLARQAGLSLLELMLAVGLVAILSAIAVPTYTAYQDRAKVAQAVRDIGEIQQRIERFRTAQMRLPDDLSDVDSDDVRDPWGHAYVFYDYDAGEVPDPSRRDRNLRPLNTDYDLYSKGKDGASNKLLSNSASDDDVIRALDGSFIGRGQDF
jgi:general secretion pathway protein G